MADVFAVGDPVIYAYASSADFGAKGVVTDIWHNPNPTRKRYRVAWDTGTFAGHTTSESDTALLLDSERSTKIPQDMAEDIATYLALDGVEDSVVAGWIEALVKYARN